MSLESDLARRVDALETEVKRLRGGVQVNYTGYLARCSTGAGQSFNNNTITVVDFGTVTRDPRSQVTTGAAWKFTAGVGGDYAIHGFVLFASSTAWAVGESGDLLLYKNGNQVSVIGRNDNSGATANFKWLQGLDVILLAAGDEINLRINQVSGGALALYNDTRYNHVKIWRLL